MREAFAGKIHHTPILSGRWIGTGINLTRWSLNRADHNQGRRNLLLKTLDALGLGFGS